MIDYIGIYQNILVKSTPLQGCFLLLVIYNISELGWFEWLIVIQTFFPKNTNEK